MLQRKSKMEKELTGASRYYQFVQKCNNILQNDEGALKYVILYTDIMGFQKLNSRYGYNEGDRFLQEYQRFWSENPDNLICESLFSDHFLCLAKMQKDADVDKVMDIWRENICGFLAKQQCYHPDIRLYAACGISLIEDEILAAIEQANQARKIAKSPHMTAVKRYQGEIEKKICYERELEAKIEKGLRDNQFECYLQPKVNIRTGKIVGAEALARWVLPDGTLAMPDKFIPIMERNGTITALDMLMLRQTCELQQRRKRAGKELLPLSVNLSRLHVLYPDSASKIHAIVQEYAVEPETIEFELTETLFIADFEDAKKLICNLREYGYRIALDDFGSGYCGLNIWQQLDFDEVKLDKVFLDEECEIHYRNQIILPKMIQIARELGVSIVCEGVETWEQVSYLKSVNCMVGQGYLFERPIPFGKMEELYDQDKKYHIPQKEEYTVPPPGETGTLTTGQLREINEDILDILPGGVLCFEKSTRNLLYAGKKFQEMTGYQFEELKELFQEKEEAKKIFIGHWSPEENHALEMQKRTQWMRCRIRHKQGEVENYQVWINQRNSTIWGMYVLAYFQRYDEEIICKK